MAIPRHYELLDEAIVAPRRCAPGGAGRGGQRRRRVQSGLRRGRRRGRRSARVRGRAVAGRAPSCGCGWRCTPGRPSSATTATTSVRRSNRCARIRAVGHGGQVLVSATTAALVADRLPPGATLEDLGWHRLKDLGRPEHIWQVIASGPAVGVPAAALARRVSPQPAGPAHAAHRPGGRDRRRRPPPARRRAAGDADRFGGRRQDPPRPRGRRRGARPVPRRRVVGRAGATGRPERRRSRRAGRPRRP